jgi:hypothetical protein
MIQLSFLDAVRLTPEIQISLTVFLSQSYLQQQSGIT